VEIVDRLNNAAEPARRPTIGRGIEKVQRFCYLDRCMFEDVLPRTGNGNLDSADGQPLEEAHTRKPPVLPDGYFLSRPRNGKEV
jgi:hypothetical protein